MSAHAAGDSVPRVVGGTYAAVVAALCLALEKTSTSRCSDSDLLFIEIGSVWSVFARNGRVPERVVA